MGNGFRIGRLLGIELRVDPSWLFIFALVGWSLTSLFSSWHPDWSLATTIMVALTSALMFFGSVLLHELAHSLVARYVYDIPVRDITLHLFGGVSSIEREPPTPGAELFIAIVGPIMSVGLGLGMILASALLMDFRNVATVDTAAATVAQLGPVATLLVWLGPVNVMVGVFNMIPGFPLDGGRILRAIVWKVTGSLHQATRIAGGAGRAVGYAFIAAGVAMALGFHVPFFGRGLGSGIWLAMIGLFLRNAAVMHLQGAAIEEALAGVRVAELMRTNGVAVDANTSLRDVIDGWFMRSDQPAYPVLENGRFAGMISIDDVRKVSGDGDPELWYTTRVRDVMTPQDKLVSTTPDEDLSGALRKLGTAAVGQMPVLDRASRATGTGPGTLVGLLFAGDAQRFVQLRAPASPRRPGSRVPRHA